MKGKAILGGADRSRGDATNSLSSLIAAHCKSCSLWWSKSVRIAPSRTSGEYLVALFMTPSSGNEASLNPDAVHSFCRYVKSSNTPR